jgi:hypothetical protein
MATISDESLEKFKKIMKEEKDYVYPTDAEARKAAQDMVNFVELLYDIWREEERRMTRLKQEPKGFALKGEGRMCSLCGDGIGDEDMWYDKWGLKCMFCQQALNKRLLPGYVFKDSKNEKHITATKLSWKLDIRHQTINKLVRQGKLKARVVPGKNRDTLVFLKKENPNLVHIVEEATAKN